MYMAHIISKYVIRSHEAISLAVYSWTIPNQKNSIRQIDRKLSPRISHNSHRQTIHLIISQHLCSGGPRVDKGVVTSLMEILRIPLMTNLETIYHLVFFLTLLALRGLCLQACYQCLVDSSFYIPRSPYLLISFYNFILFLAFPPHPMPIPHFYPFFPIGFCPVEPVDRLYPISRSDFPFIDDSIHIST